MQTTWSLSAILAVSSLLMMPLIASSDDRRDQSRLAASNNEFSFEIYRNVCAAAVGGSVFLSPISVLIGLGMVHLAASGRTRSQLTTSMHLDQYSDNESAIGEDFRGLITNLNSPSKNYTLRTANRLFANDEFQIREDFLRATKKYFQAGLQPLDFSGDPDGCRRTINDWVSETTERKIKDLLPDGSIASDTLLVVVNAIYFKGFWMNTFQKQLTKPDVFYTTRTERTTIDMMTRGTVALLHYLNSTELGCQVLELPYVGEEVSMYVFLPHDIEGLGSVESRLDSGALGRVLDSLESTRVKVSLPKFSMDQGVALKQFLEQMGMKDMFDDSQADLSGIDGTRQLKVTEAVHKAFIAVDEEGTEAAGATGFVITAKSARPMEPKYITFVADHPFFFIIVEKTSSSVMFIGRLVSPPRPGSGDIGVFGKTAEQRWEDGGAVGTASSNYAGAFLGLGFPLLTVFLGKLL